ncbi:Gfo/Idh/MocA family protein [Streptomyces sp. NPDC007808]|uniref:Gfo/Idh/MocA family protein n=1 Tax=Streptomyces sp. NPDC007808 TaxID=3364779 RepID=UPI003675846A
MDPVRMGVLGCAGIAQRRMLPAMSADPAVELVAVASRDAAKARATAARFRCRAVHGYAELLAREDVDAVYVPLPAALHATWVRAALDAGKHVLAEKPLTTDHAVTEGLIARAAAARLALMENVMFVHHPQHAAVRRLLADGTIGELRLLISAFAIPRLPDDDIRHDPELGGGALWDTGVYPVRAALYFLGQELRVEGASLVKGAGEAVDTAGTALLSTPRGVAAQLSFGIDHGYRSAYELWGSEGRISVERAFTPAADHAPRIRIERGTRTEDIQLAPDDQVARTVRAFVDAVHAGAAPNEASLHQAALLHAVRRRATTADLDRP